MPFVFDLKLAIRRLSRERGIAIAAILTLALGIGGCTGMYAVVRAVLLKSLDIVAPGQLVVMWPEFNGTPGEFSYGAFRDLRRSSASFSGIALTGSTNWPVPIPIGANGERVHLTLCPVSGNFFEVLGATASLGRTFTEADDQPGAPAVAILSDHLWRSVFRGDGQIIGRKLGGLTIVGVMPPEFFYPAGADIWQPAAKALAGSAGNASAAALAQIFDHVNAFHLIGRLKAQVPIPVARAEIGSVEQGLLGRPMTGQMASATPVGVALDPLADHVFGTARRGLWLLMGSVALLLLIACANVAGLLVARNAAHMRELAVRAALGATRWQLVRPCVMDGLVLASVGGGAGMLFARAMLPLLIVSSPTAIVRLGDARVDLGVSILAVVVTAVTVVVVTLIPAAQVRRTSVVQTMKATSTGGGRVGARGALRGTLIVAQVAMSLVLFVCATLTIKSVHRLATVDLGYTPAHVASANISQLDQTRYVGYPALLRATEEIVARAESLPDVQVAAASEMGPFAHGSIGWDTPLLAEGQAATPAAWLASPLVNVEYVSPRYFETMGIQVLSGRDFAPADRADAPPVVIVSDRLAARVWPGQSALGERLRSAIFEGGTEKPAIWQTVVGVVHSARYREVDRVREDLYMPLAQGRDFAVENIVVRTSTDARSLIQPLAGVLSAMDPALGPSNVTTLDEVVGRVEMPWRFNMALFVSFGVAAVGLTAIALVGLTSASVSWRRREIGVRVALGAQRGQVVRSILFEGTSLVLAGMAIGLLGSALLVRLLSSLLFDLSAHDPASWLVACASVFVLCVVACLLPARRAARLDPCVVFRDE